MSEPQNFTLDPAVSDQISRISAEYEAACRTSVDAGSLPPIETYLVRIASPFQEMLRHELERIRQLHQNGAALFDESPRAVTGVANVSRKADTAPASPDRTIEHTQSKRAADAGGDVVAPTMQYTPATQAGAGGHDAGLMDAGFSLDDAVRRASPELIEVPGYKIVGELGRGGMGVVYKARQVGLKRLVALKMVLAGAHAGPAQLARFYSEAEAVAGLQHPNIVQIYEVGQQSGLPFFSLEFVDGGSLADKTHRQPQPPREAAHMVETLARAMHYAHERGIIHRDLKPANVLLTATGIPKITDFGLAKRLEGDSSQTKSGTLLGTPSYMAPEQARGEIHNVGPLADIYALGVILYELVTGRPPFQAATPMDTLMRVTHEEPLPPSRLQPNVPRDLETICLKCLQKDANKRYDTAEQLAEDLRRFLSGEPILARPISGPERLWRWCKRNPKLAIAAAAIFLLLSVVSVGSTWAALTIREQKNQADIARARAEQNETIANEQADLALETLSMLVGKVQARLHREPGLQTLRLDLLETAMDGLKRLADKTSTEAGKQRNMGDAYLKMGILSMELGKSEAALDYFQRCRDILKAALDADPGNDRWKTRLAEAYKNLGECSLQVDRDMRKALAFYEDNLKLRKEIAATPEEERQKENANLKPENWLLPFITKLNLSEAYTRVGVTHYYMGDSARAEAPILQSLAVRDGLVTEALAGEATWSLCAPPTAFSSLLSVVASMPWQVTWASEHRQNLARNYHLIGEICLRLQDLDKSRRYYAKCAAIREAALKESPDDFRLRADLAEFCAYYGTVYLLLGDPREALPLYDRSIQLHREVVAKDKFVQFRRNLAIALFNRGLAMVRTKDSAGADKYFRECLEIRRELANIDPANHTKRMDLMLVLPHCGKQEEASHLAEQLQTGREKDRELLFNMGRCYTQCAVAVGSDSNLRRQYEQKALGALQAAVDQGYTDVMMLEKEPELDPVRGRPEFKSLLARVKTGPGLVTSRSGAKGKN
jgi:serine/threonine-protein kinase